MGRKKKKQPVRLLLPAPSLLHSGPRIAALSLWLRFKRFATPIHLALLGVALYFVLSSAFTASFFVPRTVNFSFSGPTCFTSPTLLPNFITKDQGDTFVATPQSSINVAGYPLYSHKTCVSPTQAPAEKIVEHISFKPLGGPFKKTIQVRTRDLPQLNYQAALAKPLSTLEPIVMQFNTPDRIFDYQLVANNKAVNCVKSDQTLSCSIDELGLQHSTTYTFTLQRFFAGSHPQPVFSKPVVTVGAVLVTDTSIAQGQQVMDVPSEITLTLNKGVDYFRDVELSKLGDTPGKLPVTTTIAGQILTIKLTKPLDRNSSFELKIQNIVATDGGHLPQPFLLAFTTSGGPKVKNVNVGSYKVSTTANIVLAFDAPLSASQNLSAFVKVEINGTAIPATTSRNGSVVTINPTDSLPKCSRFTVRVLDGLENEFGVGGGSPWSYNSRTICQSVFSIGASLKGRGITAYRFGSGGSYVVFVGGTHGNEQSSVSTLNSFIDQLERNYDQIPAHRTVVVIPNINPDGFAVSSRANARNVDLNRNFPANNWKQGVTMPGGSFNPNGGGENPLSEPESSSIANYILGVKPHLVLTYHAAAGVVMPNDSGDSDTLAKTYDQKSNVGYEPSSQTGAIFTYDTTGSMEEWLHDKHGIPALLIELWTKSSNEYSKNQTAMWHMVQLP